MSDVNKYVDKVLKLEMGNDILSVDKFDMNQLRYNENGEENYLKIVAIGKSGSGKSWIIRDIMYNLRDVPCGVVIAPTDKMSKFYDEFVPPIYIHYDVDSVIIRKLLNRQMDVFEKNEDRIKKGKKPIDPRAFLIMDDCQATKASWIKEDEINEVFFQGRHFKLHPFIMALQYSMGIGPELRTNIDFVFLLGEDFISNKRRLFEHYAGMFPTFDLFNQVFDQVTNDFGCMVINNKLRTNDIRKKVFWYKAVKRGEFNVGEKEFIKFNKETYDPEYSKRKFQESFVDSYMSKRNKNRPVIQVYKNDD